MDAIKNKGGRPRKETVVKTKQGRTGLYEYKVTVGHDELGKPIRKSFYSKKSLKAAKEKALKYIEEQAVKKATGESVTESKIKFCAIARKWLREYKKGHVKDNTYQGTYEIPVEKHLIPEFGEQNIAKITHTDIQIFFNKKGKTHTEESIKKMRACLVGIFEMAVNDYLINRNPTQGKFSIPNSKPSVKKRVYTQEQYDRILDYTKNHPFGLNIMVLMKTGISRSELLGLSPENLNDSKTLNIVRGTVEQKSTETNHMETESNGLKNKYRKRIIPIDTELYEALKHKPRVVTFQGKNKQSITVTPEFLFHSPEGKVWNPSNWYHRVYEVFMTDMHAANPDIPILNPHELRHTLATLLKNKGIEAFFINHIFGWCGSGMLDTRYAHYDPEIAREKLGWY